MSRTLAYRIACRECGHHPARAEGECSCACHVAAFRLVEATIAEERNLCGFRPDQRQKVTECLQAQREARGLLRQFTKRSIKSA